MIYIKVALVLFVATFLVSEYGWRNEKSTIQGAFPHTLKPGVF